MRTSPGEYEEARQREALIMRRLAAIVLGGAMPSGHEPSDDLRHLGYAATMAKGRVPDPEGRLNQAVKACRAALAGQATPNLDKARDALQRQWGSRWSIDPGTLRTELPLHLQRLQSSSKSESAPGDDRGAFGLAP